jgi:signal transduction histidine kinase
MFLQERFSGPRGTYQIVGYDLATQPTLVLVFSRIPPEDIALTRNEVEGNRVVLQTQLSDELPLVLGDRVQLQQLILNLMINGGSYERSYGSIARLTHSVLSL